MLFNSLAYLLFLPAVVLVYWISPSRLRLGILLIASYLFYMSWKPEYGFLLLGLSLGNFVFGRLVQKNFVDSKMRRLFFISAITANLGILALFKYTNFFIDIAWNFTRFIEPISHQSLAFANSNSSPVLPIILPLGISFFVFEFIHYLADVFKGQEPIKNPLRFGLFAAFFPSQIAGPIKRFEDFDEQAGKEKKFDPELFRSGIFLIVQGMFKKVALGDNLAPLVATGFSNCNDLNCLDAWAAVTAFTLQIYYDFSGYTDIGRGSANLLGYRLPENFNMPYIARNISEFWHRWHISLSTWLRDYLYIPLGGSRHGKIMQMRNLVITMLLGGLWHGASWTFVFWGAYHGLGLVICHSWEGFSRRYSIFQNENLRFAFDNISRILTLVFVMFGWVVFRAENLDQFFAISGGMLGISAKPATEYDMQVFRMFIESPLPLAFALYIAFNLASRLAAGIQARTSLTCGSEPEDVPALKNLDWWTKAPLSAQAVLLAAFALLILGFAPRTAVPFIYFQF